MNSMHVKLRSKGFLVIILFLQFIVGAMVFFDVPVARQVIGFIYFSFVPGFIIVKLLKLAKLDRLVTILFSIGLSIAFLMLTGFLTNEFCFLFGISKPLSLIPLMMVLNSLILVGGTLACLRDKNAKFWAAKTFEISPLSLLLICLPILSIVGAFWVNAIDGRSILLFMIFTTAVIFSLTILCNKLTPSKLYALTILSIAVALLFHSSLISNYIYGSDIHTEYYAFKLTQENGYWNSTAYFVDPRFGRFNTMLSITLLPTIYSNILNLDGTWVLKIVFPLIFSFVPLGLYKVWRTNLSKKMAFISALLVMSQMTFYGEMLGLTRQIIAELFFVLLFLVLMNKKLDPAGKKVLFTIFSIALVVSHYGIALIFLFFIAVAWLYSFLIKRKCKTLTLSLVALFFVIMFSWYIYTSASASFESIVSFGDYVYHRLTDFFDPTSRGTDVMRGLGMETVESYWQVLSRIFAYATQFFIVVGFVALMTRRKKKDFDLEYVMFSSLGMVLLAMTILLPGFALTLNMTRFYHIILFFLAPFFVLGCEALIRFLGKRRKQLYVQILILIVLIPYFLFQTGFVYEITGSSVWSVPLSKYRMDKLQLYSYGYVDESSAFGAQWISKNIDIKHTQIYADSTSRYKVLSSYGMIYEGDINVLSNTTTLTSHSTVYLSKLNVFYGKIVGTNHIWNTSEFSSFFNDINKIYSNGGSDIYTNVSDNQ